MLSNAITNPLQGRPETAEATFGFRVTAYFAFVIFSTAARSLEAGIISSMMPAISESLGMSYVGEGQVAGAPDYGIVPSGLVAIVVYSLARAKHVLVTCSLTAGVVSMIVCRYPSATCLVAVRAVTGFCWGFAAVHYPAWINGRAPQEKRTMWLAIFNVALLGGILLGYILGAVATITHCSSWTGLYGFEGCLMLLCGVIGLVFGAEDIDAEPPSEEEPTQATETTPLRPSRPSQTVGINKPTWLDVLQNPLYVSIVSAGAMQAGAIVFILYFITQYATAMTDMSPSTLTVVVAVVFVTGPISGILLGGKLVTWVGGYQQYRPALRLTAIWLSIATCTVSGLFFATLFRSEVLLTLCFFVFLSCGSCPTAVINGIAVSAVPNAAHISSGIQFTCQNLGKLVVPVVGGVILELIGIPYGFPIVLMSVGVLLSAFGVLAYMVGRDTVHPDILKQAAAQDADVGASKAP